MADFQERTTYVFEVKGGPESKREITGIASAFDSSQKAADKLATALDHTKKYLNFAEGVKSVKDFSELIKTCPQFMTLLNRELNNITNMGIRGMGKGIRELTADQRANIAQLKAFNAEYMKTHGLSSGIARGIANVAKQFASFFSVTGLTTAAIGLITKLASAVKDLADESLRLGRAEELGEARLVAITGSAAEGRAAWKQYDETTREAASSLQAFSEKDHAAAVARGKAYGLATEMGKAYLDAAKAMEATGRDPNALINQMLRLEGGLGVQKRGIAKYADVVKEAGLDLNKLTKNEYDAAEAGEKLRAALARMGESQERVIGPTAVGTMNQVKNLWTEIKESAGRMLTEVLKPIGEAILGIFKSGTDWTATMRFLKDTVLPVIKLIVFDIVIAIKEIAVAAAAINGALTVMYTIADKINGAFQKVADWLTTIQNRAEKASGVLGFILDPTGMLKGKKKAKQTGFKTPTVGSSAYSDEVDETGGSYTPLTDEEKFVPMTRGDYIETSPGVWELISEYNKKRGEKGGGAGPKKEYVPGTTRAALHAIYGELNAELPPIEIAGTEGRGGAAALSRAGLLPGQREAREKEAQAKELNERYMKIANKGGKAAADVFQATLEKGGLLNFFKNAALQFVSTVVNALATSAIFQTLAGGSQVAGGAGFLSIFKGLLGFEQEGSFQNTTAPMPVMIHPGENIVSDYTMSALAAGLQPRGGRPGFEYGPETYGRGGGNNNYFVIKASPGVNAEIELFRMVEKGRAFAEMVDG